MIKHHLINTAVMLLAAAAIAAVAFAATSVNLAWDANTEPDLAGYKIYYGTASGVYGTPIDVGNVTAYTLTGLTEGVTYYLAATAYDDEEPPNESDFSQELTHTAVFVQPDQGQGFKGEVKKFEW